MASRKSSRAGSRPVGRPKSSQTEEVARGSREIKALFLFFAGIFFVFVVFIRGQSLWKFLHDLFLGLFGVCGFALPPLLVLIAVLVAAGVITTPIRHKIWQAVVLLSMISGFIQIVISDMLFSQSFFREVGEMYRLGIGLKNAGAVGGIIGAGLEGLMGKVGAGIFIWLIIIIFILLVTNITLNKIYRYIQSRVQKAMEEKAVRLAQERAAERIAEQGKPEPGPIPAPEKRYTPAELKARFNIDVDLGPDPAPKTEQDPPEPDFLSKLQEKLKVPLPEKPPILEDIIQNAAAARKSPEETKPVPEAETKPAMTLSPNPAAGERDEYKVPPLRLLTKPQVNNADISEELKNNAAKLVETLKSFGVETKIIDISRGPAVTRYELQPSVGVKISKITSLADDLALNLAASGVRIEAPIPNKAAVGIEVPNKNIVPVLIREGIESPQFHSARSHLTVVLGRDIAGNITLADLAKMPHLLIAGTTGSGKSVCINSFLMSLLYKASPEDVRLLLIDPKVVELGVYNGIPHLLVPVVNDPRKAAGALNWAVTEMLSRYKTFAENNVRDLQGYNQLVKDKEREAKNEKSEDAEGEGETRPLKPMPQVVIVIDELADLMMVAPNEVEDAICRLAQMARAAGMHLVVATQRPSVDVVTGIIKANIPSRIAFAVSSQVDSRTILDSGGAEKLLGRGDMLFCPVGANKPIRVQGCFVSDKEVESVISYIKSCQESVYDESIQEQIEKQAVKESGGKQDGDDGEGNDDMLPKAIECVIEAGSASTSLLQRRLKLGYARAARIMDEMEQRGIIGPFEGSKPRQVLLSRQQWIEMTMNNPQ